MLQSDYCVAGSWSSGPHELRRRPATNTDEDGRYCDGGNLRAPTMDGRSTISKTRKSDARPIRPLCQTERSRAEDCLLGRGSETRRELRQQGQPGTTRVLTTEVGVPQEARRSSFPRHSSSMTNPICVPRGSEASTRSTVLGFKRRKPLPGQTIRTSSIKNISGEAGMECRREIEVSARVRGIVRVRPIRSRPERPCATTSCTPADGVPRPDRGCGALSTKGSRCPPRVRPGKTMPCPRKQAWTPSALRGPGYLLVTAGCVISSRSACATEIQLLRPRPRNIGGAEAQYFRAEYHQATGWLRAERGFSVTLISVIAKLNRCTARGAASKEGE